MIDLSKLILVHDKFKYISLFTIFKHSKKPFVTTKHQEKRINCSKIDRMDARTNIHQTAKCSD